MTVIIRGRPSIGLSSGRTQKPTLPLPDFGASETDLISSIVGRLSNLETLVERKADNDSIRSSIAISPEAIKLQARDVVVQGAFSVLDLVNEYNGTTSGSVPARITQIIGDRIRTGIIVSNNLSTTAGTSLNLNTGEVLIGGTTSPKLRFDPVEGDLTIAGKLTADSLVLTKNLTLGQISDTAAAALPAGSFGSSLQSALDAGVNNIIAGMSGNYRLSIGTTSIIAKHKDANEAGLGSGYSGDIRTGLIITGTGIGMGFNRKSDGAWINAVSIESTGDVNIRGNLTTGSIITGSVTVDGVALSTVRTNAATGSSHAATVGNPHGTSLSQISGDLDNIADGSTYFRTTATQVTGANRAANALDSSFDYIRAISTQKIVVSASNPTNGVVIDSAGFRGYSGGVLKFNINTSGTVDFAGNLSAATGTFAGSLSAATGSFAGDISAATGTFSGSINTANQLVATGSGTLAGFNAAVIGNASGSGVLSVFGYKASGATVPAVVGYTASSNTGSAGVFGQSAVNGVPAIEGLAGGFDSGGLAARLVGNVTIGSGATNTGIYNLIIREGSPGSRLDNQMIIYGQLSADADTTLGVITEQGVVAGTGPFTGINQIRIHWNGAAYWLPLNPV
jgi:hypothetical protein